MRVGDPVGGGGAVALGNPVGLIVRLGAAVAVGGLRTGSAGCCTSATLVAMATAVARSNCTAINVPLGIGVAPGAEVGSNVRATEVRR